MTLPLLAGACAHKPVLNSYRLVGQSLLPPGVTAQQKPTFRANVLMSSGTCPDTQGGITLVRRKNKLQVSVDREALSKQPDGWLTRFTADLGLSGCIAPGEALPLAERIAYSVPLDLNTATRLLRVSALSGQLEVTSAMRIQVVSPVLNGGELILQNEAVTGAGDSVTVTAKAGNNLIGFETAYYGLQKRPQGGFQIVPLYAERTISGTTEHREQPAQNAFPFPPEAAYYRLLYKTGQSEFTAIAVAARTPGELKQRADLLENGIASCARLNNELCIEIPKRLGVNAVVPVTVNGKELILNWGATVRNAIRTQIQTQPVPATLQIQKPFREGLAPVEFDHTRPEILNLVLTGGEVITY